MAGNGTKKVQQPKTFDQATALIRRANQLKKQREQQQESTGSAYGDTQRANYQREAPIRQERWGNRVVKPETQNATAGKAKSNKAATTPTAYRAELFANAMSGSGKRTLPASSGTTANGGTRGGVKAGRPSAGKKTSGTTANGGTRGNAESSKPTSTRSRIERVFASTDEAAARGAAGKPLRTKEEKGKYVSGADYKAWKTAQDKARLAAKKGK